MKKEKTIIAIDGVTATGKVAIAREVSRILGYELISSGIYYRHIAYLFLELDVKDFDIGFLKKNNFSLARRISNGNTVLFSKEIDEKLKDIVNNKEIRSFVNEEIKKMVKESKSNGFVIEGRDVGTKIFPRAEIKFFLTIQNGNQEDTIEKRKINNNIIKPSKKAIVIDTTYKNTLQITQKIVSNIWRWKNI